MTRRCFFAERKAHYRSIRRNMSLVSHERAASEFSLNPALDLCFSMRVSGRELTGRTVGGMEGKLWSEG